MNSDDKKIKYAIGLISFILGILLISYSASIPLIPAEIPLIIGALLIAFGVLNLIDLIQIIASDSKKIIGIIAFIIGLLLIEFSTSIPLPVILINVVGALIMAYGVLNLVNGLLTK